MRHSLARPVPLPQLPPQGALRARHDQNPRVLVLARVDDRHDIRDAFEFLEQELSLCSRFLGDELNDGGLAVVGPGLVHLSEARRIPDPGPEFPRLVVELYQLRHALRSPWWQISPGRIRSHARRLRSGRRGTPTFAHYEREPGQRKCIVSPIQWIRAHQRAAKP